MAQWTMHVLIAILRISPLKLFIQFLYSDSFISSAAGGSNFILNSFFAERTLILLFMSLCICYCFRKGGCEFTLLEPKWLGTVADQAYYIAWCFKWFPNSDAFCILISTPFPNTVLKLASLLLQQHSHSILYEKFCENTRTASDHLERSLTRGGVCCGPGSCEVLEHNTKPP